MVGKHISSLGESGVHPLFGLRLPIMAASGGVIFYANIVKSAYNETGYVGSQIQCHLGPSCFHLGIFVCWLVASFINSGH